MERSYFQKLFSNATLMNPYLSLPASGVHSEVKVKKNHQEVVVRLGESVDLVCSADTQVDLCTFVNAKGVDKPFYPNAKHDRMKKINKDNGRDCAVQVCHATCLVDTLLE